MSSAKERGKLGGKKTAEKGKEYYAKIGRKGGLKSKRKPFPDKEDEIYYTAKAIAKPYNPLIEQLDEFLDGLK